MVLDAIVNPDGTLIAKVPRALWGKKVQLTIIEQEERPSLCQDLGSIAAHGASEDNNRESLAQWEAMSAILKEVDKLDIPRRTIGAILHDLHEFRETD